MRVGRFTRAWAAPVVLFALALASEPAISARGGHARHPSDGEWVGLIQGYESGVFCGTTAPVIVPSENLVLAFEVGAECGGGLGGIVFAPTPTPLRGRLQPWPAVGVPLSGVLDPLNHRVLYFFSEWDGSKFTDLTTWALSLDDTLRWERIETAGAPPYRYGTSLVLDTQRQQVLMFGGRRVDGGRIIGLDEVWSLSLADLRWERLTPAGPRPPGRENHTAIYDSERDRMVVFGGVQERAPSPFDDLWALSLGNRPRWSRIDPDGERPRGRYAHSAIYDSRGRRMVIYSGIDTVGALGPWYVPPYDVWELSLRGRERWRRLEPRGVPRTAWAWAAAAYDPDRNRMLAGDTENLYSLEWDGLDGPAQASPDAAPTVAQGATGRPELADPVASGEAREGVEVRLYDIAGRLVLARNVQDVRGWLDALRAGSATEAAGMAPGVYFAQRRDRSGTVVSSRILLLKR
jgi:hypothetical protein